MTSVPDRVNSSARVRAAASAPSGLWAPSSTTVGSRCTTSNRPGSASWANAGAHRVVVEAAAEERLGGGQRDRRVVGLVGAVHGQEDVVDGPLGRAQREQATTEGQLVLDHVELHAAHPGLGCGHPAKRSASSGSSSPSTKVESGLTMPDFSSAMRRRQSPMPVGVVGADVGEHGHPGVAHVGGVVATEQPHLHHGHVDGQLGEPAERRGREQLEVRRPLVEHGLECRRGRR